MRVALACAALACTSAVPAHAQHADTGISATVEISSDERRRGLSWSGGDPVLRGSASAQIAEGLSIDGTVVSLWDSLRHGGGGAAVDIGATYVRHFGGWRLSAESRYHLFPGASDQGYGEVGAGAGFLIGPASIGLFGSYAPRQSSIGGDNLYLSAAAEVAVPGTPFTMLARIGRSSGEVHNPAKAARLRPDGTYWDHGVGIEYLKGRWSAGLRYANSSIDGPDSRNAGATVIGRVGLSL